MVDDVVLLLAHRVGRVDQDHVLPGLDLDGPRTGGDVDQDLGARVGPRVQADHHVAAPVGLELLGQLLLLGAARALVDREDVAPDLGAVALVFGVLDAGGPQQGQADEGGERGRDENPQGRTRNGVSRCEVLSVHP